MTIVAGQHLLMPVTRLPCTRGAGETLYSVARHYQVDQSELTRLNNMRSPYTVRVGQRLKLPAPQVREPEATVAARPRPSPRRDRDRVVTPISRNRASVKPPPAAPPRRRRSRHPSRRRREAEKRMALANPPP